MERVEVGLSSCQGDYIRVRKVSVFLVYCCSPHPLIYRASCSGGPQQFLQPEAMPSSPVEGGLFCAFLPRPLKGPSPWVLHAFLTFLVLQKPELKRQ